MNPLRTQRHALRKLAREQEATTRAAERSSRNARAKIAREQAAIERLSPRAIRERAINPET